MDDPKNSNGPFLLMPSLVGIDRVAALDPFGDPVEFGKLGLEVETAKAFDDTGSKLGRDSDPVPRWFVVTVSRDDVCRRHRAQERERRWWRSR